MVYYLVLTIACLQRIHIFPLIVLINICKADTYLKLAFLTYKTKQDAA